MVKRSRLALKDAIDEQDEKPTSSSSSVTEAIRAANQDDQGDTEVDADADPDANPVDHEDDDDVRHRQDELEALREGIQVFADIPIPTWTRKPRESKYRWADLTSPGMSFFVPGAKPATFHTLTATRNKAERDRAEKNPGQAAKVYLAKAYTHEGVAGVMVWRTQ